MPVSLNIDFRFTRAQGEQEFGYMLAADLTDNPYVCTGFWRELAPELRTLLAGQCFDALSFGRLLLVLARERRDPAFVKLGPELSLRVRAAC